MTQPFVLKYRPKKFAHIAGQRLSALVLARMVEAESVPNALLFSGPSGVGKTSAARILATAMGAVDVIELDAASNGGVDEIRKVIDFTKYAANGHRVVILDEAHSLSKQAFEALLKTLEEPAQQNTFVLVTTEPGRIPDTVLSRLVEFQFRALSSADIYNRLAVIANREDVGISDELLKYLAARAEGNMRTAIQSLDTVAQAGLSTVEEYRELSGDGDSAPDLLIALLSGKHDEIFEKLDDVLTFTSPAQVVADLIECVRDLLVLKAGGTIDLAGDFLDKRKFLALRLEQERILAAVRLLWDLRTKVRAGNDPKGNLELAAILLSEVFTRGRSVPVVAPQQQEKPKEPERRLTLEEMMSE